jgi:hypothetical protein
MIEIPELPNPFTGGKILGCGIDPKEYRRRIANAAILNT